MRGVGPVPVMSPMSKSFRKRERPRSSPKNTPATSSSSKPSSSPKRPKICPESAPENPQAKKPAAAAPPPAAVKSPALSAASASSSSSLRNVSSPSTPDPPGTRSLRPRPCSSSEVAARRTRRPFCDVSLTEDDATRLVGRRIKVWWPLDEKWYTGDIRNYDGEQRRHWVVYDDHDEEWLRLERERFKIQLRLGDGLQRAPLNTTSTYLLHRAPLPAPDRAPELPKPASEENSSSIFGESSSPKPVCVYVRRRQKKPATTPEPVEVESPPPPPPPPPPSLDVSERGFTCAWRGSDSEACSSSSSSSSPGVGFRIERWPLSRNLMELMRFVEIRAGGRRSGVSSRLLRHVWRGTLPVSYIGDLFGLRFGSSTVVHALSETTPSFMNSEATMASVCMLISWNGFTIEKNARLREVVDASLKQVRWRSSSPTGSGAKMSVTLLCGEEASSSSSSSSRLELGSCSNTYSKHSPFALLPCSSTDMLFLLNTSLRGLFERLWRDLSGAAGLRLPGSFTQSWRILPPGLLPLLLRVHRMSKELGALIPERRSPAAPSSFSRLGIHHLLSMSRKGRRSSKGMKRSSAEDPLLPFPKRVRIALPDPQPKARRVPAPPRRIIFEEEPEEDRSGGEEEEEAAMIGDDEAFSLEDFDPEDLCGGGKRKRRRGGDGGGYSVDPSSASASPSGQQDFSPCTANLLIVQADRGWRESGVVVELQRSGGGGAGSAALIVSLNGDVLYSYKAKRYYTLPGGSNRFTHAMMWRGGHDWILEFPDRLQWRAFRRMHDACVRAQFVKQLPVPAFSEVPGYFEESCSSLPFFRPREYIQRVSKEVDAALLSSGLYDMDREDEVWLEEFNSGKESGGGFLSEEVFERVVHQLECSAFIREEFSESSAVELCGSLAPPGDIRAVHAHWLRRRQKTGMALIRCFQPAPYDRYSALLQAWQTESVKRPGLEQPARFAFCLRPNEAPKKMQRQRPQRKAAMARHWNVEDLYADQDLEDSYGHKQDSYSADAGSPGSDDASYVSKQRSNRGRRPYKRARRMKTTGGGELENINIHHISTRRHHPVRTFIAPATAMNLDTPAAAAAASTTVDVVVDQLEGESCSSMEFDVNEDALRKAQQARKAARVAAAKAARAQELYGLADAAMKRAVACVIEAEALAAAESAAREMMKMNHQQQQQQQQVILPECGEACEAEIDHQQLHHLQQHEEEQQEDEDDDDLLLPICNWTQEFGSGLLHKGGDDSGGGGGGGGVSPRKSLKYVNVAASQNSQLFKVEI